MDIMLSYPIRGIDKWCIVSGFLNSDDYFVVQEVYTTLDGEKEYEITCLTLFEIQDKINQNKLWIPNQENE